MNAYGSSLSYVIEMGNVIGMALQRTGLPVGRLDEHALLKEARRRTGLADFGDDAFYQPLRMLLASYESEAGLTWVGRLAARRDAERLLMNRLRLVDDRKRYPGIATQEIRRPLFIMGLPRTGSTLLHNLLAQDPANRAPLTWEVLDPSPPPADREHDPRIKKVQKLLNRFDRLAPSFKAIHPMGTRQPIECVAIMSHTFISPQFQSTYRIPSYQKWLNSGDLRSVYRFHREFLQHLQWAHARERWVLKAPFHLVGLDALLSVYPDARIVQTHRDPRKVIASVASLDAVLRRAFSHDVDLKAIGAEALSQWSAAVQQGITLRKKYDVASPQFLDVYYSDLVRDPLSTIRNLYRHFEMELSPEAERRMQVYVTQHPKDQHGPHRYSLAQFGLIPEEVSAYFTDYTRVFGVPVES